MLIKDRYKVIVKPDNSLTKEKLELLEKFSNIAKKNIVVYNKDFSGLEIVNEEKINKDNVISVCQGILFDGKELLGVSASLNSIPTIKEIDLSPLDEARESKRTNLYTGNFKIVNYYGYGEPIFDRGGNILAEITPDKNIVFFLDLLSKNIDSNILKYVLDEASLYMFNESISGRKESYSNGVFLYKNIASKKIDDKIKGIKETVKRADEKIEIMQERLITMIRLRDKAEVMMNSEYELRSTLAEQIKKDLDDISKLKGYKMIRFLNDKVIGVTEDIFITYKGSKYKLGKYRIEIGFDNGNVRFYNAGKNYNCKSKSTIHPHIINNQACLGNIQSVLPGYVAKYEFSTVFDLLYQLLSTYNDSSPYGDGRIENFPKV